MTSNLKQYIDFIYDWERIQTETYLTLLCNAAGKKAEARKRILANDESIDAAMKAARKYMRIMLILDEPSGGLDPEGIHEMRQTILRLHRELRVTILLSSHFLNEVEQICTSIAVLNQGRKVFEGSLAETRRRERWIRLKTADFPRAVEILGRAGMIHEHRGEHLVALTEKGATDQVVRVLVQENLPVYEIAHAEETLEEFYLSLMENERRGANGQPPLLYPRARN